MVSFTIFAVLALLVSSISVDCTYSSSGSGASSSSDGSGHAYTHNNNNGHGTYHSTGYKPNYGGFENRFGGPTPNNFPFNGLGQNNYGGGNYGPAFPYNNPFNNFNPFFNANPAFMPFATFQFPPFQPLAPPEEFNKYLTTLGEQYMTGGTTAQAGPGATAFATSYLGPTDAYNRQQQQIQAWQAQIQAQAQQPLASGPNYAYATGAYGPHGIHQTAGVHPPNPNQPNLDDRFGAENTVNGPKPGYFGVQTASFSASSNVNGHETHKEGAITTVNDNGNVTTYKVES